MRTQCHEGACVKCPFCANCDAAGRDCFLYEAALTAARAIGLSDEYSIDAAIAFSEHMVLAFERTLSDRLTLAEPQTWVRRCARNFVISWRRRESVRQRRETALSDQPDGITASAVDPAQEFMADELRGIVLRALSGLKPGPRELFLRHVFLGEGVADLAQQTGRAPGATRVSLSSSARRMREILSRMVFPEGALREYLIAPPSLVPGRSRALV